MFSLKFADVELGVCRKELNSDIPPTHGYPQQVEYDFGDFGHGDEEGGVEKILMVMLLLLIMLLLMLKMLQLPHEEGPG